MDNRYKKLAGNTLLFAISNFSSKLLSLFMQPFITHAMAEVSQVGVTKITSQIGNLLIPLVSLGISYAIIRFGLDKENSKSQVFTNGLLSILSGFGVLVVLFPLARLVPIFNEYLFLLYLYVLVSCLRTLCTQFVRSRQLNKLVAVDGILCTFTTFCFYILFLLVIPMGPAGYLLAIICGDATSAVFVFCTGGLRRYLNFQQVNKKLWKSMLAYSLPMIPAQISFWIINASDLFFVTAMMGAQGTYWSGLLGTGYFLPTILTTLGTIFYEAWQLSAVTETAKREQFFSHIFTVYQSVMFCCGAGIILLCQPMMILFQRDFFEAWRFVPFLAIATVYSCFNQFLNSIYVVEKRSTLSLYTMLAGAVLNCFLNYFFIAQWGAIGATAASLLSYLFVFLLRAINTRGLLRVDFSPWFLALNTLLLLAESALILGDVTLWPLWCTLITIAVCALNLRGVWAMLRRLLHKA